MQDYKWGTSALAISLLFCLTVACGGGGGSSSGDGGSSITSVPTTNSQPTADAGQDLQVATGKTITLDGSQSSDGDGDPLTYHWTLTEKPDGSNATLSSTTEEKPSFSVDIAGTYQAELIVNDGTTDSLLDSITIIAESNNTPPVADAGIDQSIVTDSLVMLDGSNSSDVDNDELSYQWTISTSPSGSQANLIDTNSAFPSFTPDLDGNYIIELTVNDGTADNVTDSVSVLANTGNAIPIAQAGEDIEAIPNQSVRLDGTQSTDSDLDTLTYLWSFESTPNGSTAFMPNPLSAFARFTPDLAGIYVLKLTVDDGQGNTSEDTLTVSVNTAEVLLSLLNTETSPQEFLEVTWPYSGIAFKDASTNGQSVSNFILDTFKITAVGSDLTLTNFLVVDTIDITDPSINGLTDGMVIREGETLEFQLRTTPSGGEMVFLIFSFGVVETEEIFSMSYTFTSD